MDIEAPDIVIVGLGPAGSRAATVAAGAGCSVIAIERRLEAGCPVQCADFTEARHCTETPDFRGWMIDRAAFDRMLAAEAGRAGAECRYGTSVLAIDSDGTVHTSDARVLRPRLLIGCDGPRSRVGAAIGQSNRALVDTRQVTAPLIVPHDATDIFLSAEYPGGYGWLFPRGAVANVGIGVMMDHRQRLKVLLAELFARLSALRRIGTHPFALTGGAIPVGGAQSAGSDRYKSCWLETQPD
jgi:digeranylgeranylglycerophospholipid reductase